MYYYFKTDIDCKACLDNVLFDFFKVAVGNIVYYFGDEGAFEIVVESNNETEQLEDIIEKRKDVSNKIIGMRSLEEKEFIELKNAYKAYTESLY